MNALEKYAAKKKLAQTLRQRVSSAYGKVKNFGNSLKNYAKINPADTARTAASVLTGRGIEMATSDMAKRTARIFNLNNQNGFNNYAKASRRSQPSTPSFTAGRGGPGFGRPAAPAPATYRPTRTVKPSSGGVGQSLPPFPPRHLSGRVRN